MFGQRPGDVAIEAQSGLAIGLSFMHDVRLYSRLRDDGYVIYLK